MVTVAMCYCIQERLLIADQATAAAEACFELTRDYIKERKAFGQPISNLQTIKHKMAEMKYVLPQWFICLKCFSKNLLCRSNPPI